jgi:predicted transcriptional regulator
MTRPPIARVTPDEDVVFIGFKVVESMAESLAEMASATNINRSALIRDAISEYLAAHQGVAA